MDGYAHLAPRYLANTAPSGDVIYTTYSLTKYGTTGVCLFCLI